MKCPNCKKNFKLKDTDYIPVESGRIYASCPACCEDIPIDYYEEQADVYEDIENECTELL